MPAKRYSMTSCSVGRDLLLVDDRRAGRRAEVDEERRGDVARRPVAADVHVVVGDVAGAAVDDGLDDGVDVELVAVLGVVDAHPALGADERELAAERLASTAWRGGRHR